MVHREGDFTFIIRRVACKGYGVFADSPIPIGELVLVAPVVIFPNKDAKGLLHCYSFEWNDAESALALSIGSLLNHSYRPNLIYQMLRKEKAIRFVSIRPIAANDELTINYGFDPEYKGPVGFRVV